MNECEIFIYICMKQPQLIKIITELLPLWEISLWYIIIDIKMINDDYLEWSWPKNVGRKKARWAEKQLHIFRADYVLTGASATLCRPSLFLISRCWEKNLLFRPSGRFFRLFQLRSCFLWIRKVCLNMFWSLRGSEISFTKHHFRVIKAQGHCGLRFSHQICFPCICYLCICRN